VLFSNLRVFLCIQMYNFAKMKYTMRVQCETAVSSYCQYLFSIYAPNTLQQGSSKAHTLSHWI